MPNAIARILPGVIASIALLAVWSAGAGAADVVVGAEAAGPVSVGVIAIKSLDSLAAAARQLGVNLPAFLTARDIGDTFPNIGAGGMATDKPIGVIFLAGADITAEQVVVYALPVKAGLGSLEVFRDQGATALAGHVDTVILRGTTLRRTADYLLIGQCTAGVAAINTDDLANVLQAPDALVHLTIDLKKARQIMPRLYDSLMKSWQQQAIAATATNPVARLFMPRLQDAVGGLDRVDVYLHNSADGMRLGLTLSPFKLPAAVVGNRPGMPGVFCRMDVAQRMSGLSALHEPFVNAIVQSTDAERPGQPLTDDQKQRIADVFGDFDKIVFQAATTSVGIEMAGGVPVVYIVQSWPRPIDYSMEIRRWYLQSVAADPERQSKVDFFTYEKSGLKILRIVPSTHGKPQYYLDVLQRDDHVFMAACANSFGYIQTLLDAPPAPASFTPLVSISVDLGKLAEGSTNMLGSPLTNMPPEKQKQVIDLLRGQKATFSTSAAADGATFEVAIDSGLVRNSPKLLQLFGIASAEAQ